MVESTQLARNVSIIRILASIALNLFVFKLTSDVLGFFPWGNSHREGLQFLVLPFVILPVSLLLLGVIYFIRKTIPNIFIATLPIIILFIDGLMVLVLEMGTSTYIGICLLSLLAVISAVIDLVLFINNEVKRRNSI